MKWQMKLLWTVIIAFVGMGIWILSFPFSGDQINTVEFDQGMLDLSEYNVVVNGPVNIIGEVKYVPNKILYDDAFLEDHLEESVWIPVDEFLDADKFGNQTYGTYVMEIIPPQNMTCIALEIPDISCSYKMWSNGNLITSMGRVDSRISISKPMTMTNRIIIPSHNERLRILVQVSNYDHHHTGFQGSIILGTAEQIMNRKVDGNLREYLIITSALLIGLYHIAIYAMREDETASLHFGLFSIFLALTLSFFGEKSIYNVFPHMGWEMRLHGGYFLSMVTMLLLLRYIILLGERRTDNVWEKLLQASLVVNYLGMALTIGYAIQSIIVNIYVSLILIIILYSFVQIIKQMTKKEVGMRLAAFGLFAAIIILLLDLSDIYGEKFSSYGLFIFIFSQALTLGFRYSEAFKLNVNLASELRLNARILEERNSEIEFSKNTLENLNKELDYKVNERTEDIRLLLDHSGQAFLSLDEYSKIQPGFSKLTQLYIGDNIREADLWDIFYTDTNEMAELLRTAVNRAIHETSLLRRNSYLALLPDVMTFNDHELSIEYKWIKTEFKEQIMVIMTDVTYEKSLIEQIDEETRDNQSNLKIILNSQEFWMIHDEFEAFFNNDVFDEIDENIDLRDLRDVIRKKLHYFKGSFSMYGLSTVIEEIHNIEEALTGMSKVSKETFKSLFRTSKALYEMKIKLNRMAINEGIDIYAYKDSIMVSKAKMSEISNGLKEKFGENAKDYVDELDALNHLPFRKMFESYVDYVSLLGKDIGKEVNPLQISGGEFLIDPVHYEGFSRAMVHIFRNIIDHGIEKAETRFERGKPIAGNIEMKISRELHAKKDYIHLEIRDDGNGINKERLKKMASESLKINESIIEQMDATDLYQLIFSADITTKTFGDIVSGQGLGMTIVKEEVQELGGTIHVNSVEQKGVHFVIDLPYRY